ncbi:hypothetical protein KQI65_01450 [bacterium]|nr:hypothetical protein [bacterium]
MLPTGIFGICSRRRDEIDSWLKEVELHVGEEQLLETQQSADGSVMLGVIRSARYPYPALLSEAADGAGIGVFDGVMFEESVLSREPHALATLPVEQLSRNCNGMFQSASCDGTHLRLVSDPFASLPLYYSLQEQGAVFSTSLRMVCRWKEARGGLRQDEDGMAQLLAFGFALGGKTMYAGIHRMTGASLVDIDLTGDAAQSSHFRYDTVEVHPAPYDGLEADIVDAFREAVLTLHDMEGTGSIAALTGGLDSRTIAAVLHAEGRDCSFVTHYMQEGHDIGVARETVRLLGLQHHEERLPDTYDLMQEKDDFLAAGNGVLSFNNIHASEVHRRYARYGSMLLDGNHTSIEGRWFMRNTAARVKTRDDFLRESARMLLQEDVLGFTRDADRLRRRAIEQLEQVIPDPRNYADSAYCADSFYVQQLLPQHVTDLALMQNQHIRYVTPYYDRRYVALIARMEASKRWRQRPQQLSIETHVPQLRRLHRAYSDVLSWPTANPWLLRVPVALERLYRRAGLSRWPRLYHAVSRYAPSVRPSLRFPPDLSFLDIDDQAFDRVRIRDAFTASAPVTADYTLMKLLPYLMKSD